MISVAAGKSETIRITFYCMQFPGTRTGKGTRTGEEKRELKNFKSRELSAGAALQNTDCL